MVESRKICGIGEKMTIDLSDPSLLYKLKALAVILVWFASFHLYGLGYVVIGRVMGLKRTGVVYGSGHFLPSRFTCEGEEIESLKYGERILCLAIVGGLVVGALPLGSLFYFRAVGLAWISVLTLLYVFLNRSSLRWAWDFYRGKKLREVWEQAET
jgi:hypothetical protein